jgi:hypothetical protein
VKHKQSSSETQLVEITEDQGKEIVSNMKVLSEVEVQKVTAAGTIANKQLEYFKLRDKEIAMNQRGLVEAVANLSHVIGMAVAKRSQRSPRCRPPTSYNFDDIMEDADIGDNAFVVLGSGFQPQ